MEWHERGDDMTHTESRINGFFGDYRWLSNFHPCKVEYEGIIYSSSEAAYQAAKTDDIELKKDIAGMTASESKKVGKHLKIRPDWEGVKVDEMYKIVAQKFSQNPELVEKLLATGDKHLEETNWWGDTFWGVCKGVGQNELGEILMLIREEFRLLELIDKLS